MTSSGPSLTWLNPVYSQDLGGELTETIQCTSGDILLTGELITFTLGGDSSIVFKETGTKTYTHPSGILGEVTVNIISSDHRNGYEFTLTATAGVSGNVSAPPLTLRFNRTAQFTYQNPGEWREYVQIIAGDIFRVEQSNCVSDSQLRANDYYSVLKNDYCSSSVKYPPSGKDNAWFKYKLNRYDWYSVKDFTVSASANEIHANGLNMVVIYVSMTPLGIAGDIVNVDQQTALSRIWLVDQQHPDNKLYWLHSLPDYSIYIDGQNAPVGQEVYSLSPSGYWAYYSSPNSFVTNTRTQDPVSKNSITVPLYLLARDVPLQSKIISAKVSPDGNFNNAVMSTSVAISPVVVPNTQDEILAYKKDTRFENFDTHGGSTCSFYIYRFTMPRGLKIKYFHWLDSNGGWAWDQCCTWKSGENSSSQKKRWLTAGTVFKPGTSYRHIDIDNDIGLSGVFNVPDDKRYFDIDNDESTIAITKIEGKEFTWNYTLEDITTNKNVLVVDQYGWRHRLNIWMAIFLSDDLAIHMSLDKLE